MHPQLQHWHDAFLQIRDEAAVFAQSKPREVFNAPPAAGRWSAAQCFAHLNVVSGLLIEAMEPRIEQARQEGVTGTPPFRPGLLGSVFTFFLQPGRMPVKTVALYEPPTADTFQSRAQVMEIFTELQNRYADVIRRSEGVDLARVKVASPALTRLRFNAAAWLDATLAHERRHFAQAREAVRLVAG